jgi:hypothetical protein
MSSKKKAKTNSLVFAQELAKGEYSYTKMETEMRTMEAEKAI